MDPPSAYEDDSARWQAEADLLADGRDLIERLCGSPRWRYLYPEGPNIALLLEAYQDFDRLRTVGRIRGGRWRQGRRFKRILRDLVRRDVIARSHRLSYHYPLPRLHRLPPPPEIVRRALAAVDADVRPGVEAYAIGSASSSKRGGAMTVGGTAVAGVPTSEGSRGMAQFRDALVNEALAHPSAIPMLHPQYVRLLTAQMPTKRHHPIASFLLVKLPLQLMLAIITLFNIAYVGAYYYFNDEVLGEFVSTRVSGLIEGELEMKSIHWEGRLIFDLLTGTPHHVVVDDVDVWDAYASFGGERKGRSAHADRVEATLVLHEIIPWNRAGIPTLFEIPWVLHFPEVRIEEPIWFSIRQYDDVDDAGQEHRLLSLTGAFQVLDDDPDRRGLSFAVDDARLATTIVDIDFTQTSTWRNAIAMREAEFDLSYDAPDPDFPRPMKLPFAFNVRGSGGEGLLIIDQVEVPLDEFELRRMSSNQADVSAGDVIFAARGEGAGSPVALDGILRDVFPRKFDDAPPAPTTVSMRAETSDAGPLTEHILSDLELPPTAVTATHASVTATIEGRLTEPRYTLVADGLALDVLDEAAWVADDVALALSIENLPIPERWASHYEGPVTRNVVTFDHASGSLLDGSFNQLVDRDDAPPAQIVIPKGGEPYLLSASLGLQGINPGQLFPDDLEMSSRATGAADGALLLHELVLAAPDDDPALGPTADPAQEEEEKGGALVRAHFELDEFEVTRDRGPRDDSLPQRLDIDGTVTIDEHANVELGDFSVGTDGARLDADGHIEDGGKRLRSMALAVRVDDGAAFARAFAIEEYFDLLDARMNVFGPTKAPSGSDGRLTITGLVRDSRGVEGATMSMDRGVLSVSSPNAHFFGGHGPVDLRIGLFEPNGQPSKDPRVAATIALDDVDIANLVDGPLRGRARIELDIGDGQGSPERLSAIRVEGVAGSDELRIGRTTYRGAEVAFGLTPEELAVHRLVLPIHRPISPRYASHVTVPVGKIIGQGTITLESDPALDLVVSGHGVPLGEVGELLGVEVPLLGQIADGTELTVSGRLAQPKIEGSVALENLAAAGIRLGSGQLDVTSDDFEAEGNLAAHREVRVRGELATPSRVPRREAVQWTIDAVMAVGRSDDVAAPTVSAQVDVEFDRVSIPALLRDPLAGTSPPVNGRLEGLTAKVLTCNPGDPMLSDCARAGTGDEQSLAIELDLGRAWVRSTTSAPLAESADPCRDPSTLCSANDLSAAVDWPRVELSHPWRLVTGPRDDRAMVEISGSFDLSDPTPLESKIVLAAAACEPPPVRVAAAAPKGSSKRAGTGQASIKGELDFEALAPLLEILGLSGANGRLALDLDVAGYAQDPRVDGSVRLVETDDGFSLRLAALPYSLDFSALDLQVGSGWLSAAGTMKVLGGEIQFGSYHGGNTGYAFSGPCRGAFGAAAKGVVSSALLATYAGDTVVGGNGGIDLRGARVEGRNIDGVTITALNGTVGFDDHDLRLEFADGITSMTLTDGTAHFELCTGTKCSGQPEGWIHVTLGDAEAEGRGPGGRRSGRPRGAIVVQAGPRGQAFAWGETYLAPDFSQAASTNLSLALENVPYRSFDHRGRLVYEGELTAQRVALTGGAPLVVTGKVGVDRARYVKDAVKGVEILALTDDVEVPSAPPPSILQGMQFDLEVETDRPLRVENNIASGVAAQAVVDIAGTWEDPEFTGRLDFEPGGAVDIPFVTGTYEIQRGRVTLLRRIEDAEVDVLAVRQEPIYINGQTRQIRLLLAGPVSAIRWSCISDGGDVGSDLDTVRGCTEYLVLGAGDVQLSDNDVQRFGGGGLANARKATQVVGHLTELDVGERAADAVPRARNYVPDMKLRLGQIGPELEVANPPNWWEWDWGKATVGWDYTRGYPGFLLRQSREVKLQLEILDPMTIEYSRRQRSYLNERIIFDPLDQQSVELRFDVQIPSIR